MQLNLREIDLIVDTVARCTGVSRENILSAKRLKDRTSHSRKLAMYMAFLLVASETPAPQLSPGDRGWSALGRYFHRDHSTIISAITRLTKDARPQMIRAIEKECRKALTDYRETSMYRLEHAA